MAIYNMEVSFSVYYDNLNSIETMKYKFGHIELLNNPNHIGSWKGRLKWALRLKKFVKSACVPTIVTLL